MLYCWNIHPSLSFKEKRKKNLEEWYHFVHQSISNSPFVIFENQKENDENEYIQKEPKKKPYYFKRYSYHIWIETERVLSITMAKNNNKWKRNLIKKKSFFLYTYIQVL